MDPLQDFENGPPTPYSNGSQTVNRGSLGSRSFLPGEPRTITIFSQSYPFLIILFQFAFVDILQFILDIWSHTLCYL